MFKMLFLFTSFMGSIAM